MDVAPEPTRMCLWRVLKEGTARPRLPCRLRVTWSTDYLESRVYETGITLISMLFCANEKEHKNYDDSTLRTWNPQSRTLAIRKV